ncbi:MAG: hypothetical protein WC533_00985 [Candidatus Pacearchaeota archaeon]
MARKARIRTITCAIPGNSMENFEHESYIKGGFFYKYVDLDRLRGDLMSLRCAVLNCRRDNEALIRHASLLDHQRTSNNSKAFTYAIGRLITDRVVEY